MPSVTLRRNEGETEEQFHQRLQEHEEEVARNEYRLLQTRRQVEKKWGKR